MVNGPRDEYGVFVCLEDNWEGVVEYVFVALGWCVYISFRHCCWIVLSELRRSTRHDFCEAEIGRKKGWEGIRILREDFVHYRGCRDGLAFRTSLELHPPYRPHKSALA